MELAKSATWSPSITISSESLSSPRDSLPFWDCGNPVPASSLSLVHGRSKSKESFLLSRSSSSKLGLSASDSPRLEPRVLMLAAACRVRASPGKAPSLSACCSAGSHRFLFYHKKHIMAFHHVFHVLNNLRKGVYTRVG